MQTIKLKRHSPYSAAQMFALVIDIEAYPLFLPYCTGARIISRKTTPNAAYQELIEADLMIHYKALRGSYRSDVKLFETPLCIEVTQAQGPFRNLYNKWQFSPHESGQGSVIDFELDFTFRIALFKRLIAPLISNATARMIDAFESRADTIYRPKID